MEAKIYQADFDPTTSSVRLNVIDGSIRTKVAAYLADHPDASANKVVGETGVNRQQGLKAVAELRFDDHP